MLNRQVFSTELKYYELYGCLPNEKIEHMTIYILSMNGGMHLLGEQERENGRSDLSSIFK